MYACMHACMHDGVYAKYMYVQDTYMYMIHTHTHTHTQCHMICKYVYRNLDTTGPSKHVLIREV